MTNHIAPVRKTTKAIERDIDAAILDALIERVGDDVYFMIFDNIVSSTLDTLGEKQRREVAAIYGVE